MSLTQKITALAGALALSCGAAFANETAPLAGTATATAAPAPMEAAADRPLFANPFDPSTWWDGTDGMDHAELARPEAFNMAHPSFWMGFVDPKTHTKRHMQFTNPATYAQFMDPATWMQFANPSNWMAWMDPKNYAPMAKAETYAYWMQPGAYMHAMQPKGYMQMLDAKNYAAFMNPAAYMKFMDPSAYDMSQAGEGIEKGMEMLNPATVFDYVTSMLDTGN